MGSSSSKAAQGVARKFPTRVPGAVPPSAGRFARPSSPSQPASRPQASTTKSDAIKADSGDPDSMTAEFSQRLRQMGIAQPNPTYSSTSTAMPAPDPPSHRSPGPSYPSPATNTTLAALEARRLLEQRAEAEFDGIGRKGSKGREFLDLNTIIQIHVLRERGVRSADIESRFDLKAGVVDKLGRPGITSPFSAPSK